MNKSSHKSSHKSGKQSTSPSIGVYRKKNKWLLWVGVILMVLAMIAYVMTLDESEVPGRDGEMVPAEAP